MSQAQSIDNDIQFAAHEIMSECPHALPPVSILVSRLSEAEQHRDELLKMLHASNRYMKNMISPLQHQMLLEFTSTQAAKANIEHQDMLDEICMQYNIVDVQMLLIRDFWEALNFSWHYAEGKI